MRVLLTAYTVTNPTALGEIGYVSHADSPSEPEPEMMVDLGTSYTVNPEWVEWARTNVPTDADESAEAAGRLCYLSFDRLNPKTAENKDYLANIIRQKHFSIFEHASATFYVEGVSRALLLELERHRFLSFSVVSQRYVDHSEALIADHPMLRELGEPERAAIYDHVRASRHMYGVIVDELELRGKSRKEARGAARLVLPEGTETKFFVTGNLRAWRDIIEKRNSEHADQEIREFAAEVLRHLKEYAPNTFQDME